MRGSTIGGTQLNHYHHLPQVTEFDSNSTQRKPGGPQLLCRTRSLLQAHSPSEESAGDTPRRNRRHIQLVNEEQPTAPDEQCNRPTKLSVNTSDPTPGNSDTGMGQGTGQYDGPVTTRLG